MEWFLGRIGNRPGSSEPRGSTRSCPWTVPGQERNLKNQTRPKPKNTVNQLTIEQLKPLSPSSFSLPGSRQRRRPRCHAPIAGKPFQLSVSILGVEPDSMERLAYVEKITTAIIMPRLNIQRSGTVCGRVRSELEAEKEGRYLYVLTRDNPYHSSKPEKMDPFTSCKIH